MNCRDEWNKRREETSDEKNRRECEEMLEDIKEEKKNVEELTKLMMKEKNDLNNVKIELNELIEKGKVIEMNKQIETQIKLMLQQFQSLSID